MAVGIMGTLKGSQDEEERAVFLKLGGGQPV